MTRQMTDAIGLREPLMEGPLFRAWVDMLFASSILFTAGGGLQSRLAWPGRRSRGGGRASWAAVTQSALHVLWNLGDRRLDRGLSGNDSRMRILELGLEAADVAAQAAFWGDTLGVPVRDPGAGGIDLELQDSIVRFAPAGDCGNPRYHFAINIPRGSIERAAAWVEERHALLAFHDDPDVEEGATIVRTDRGASTVYFLDAGGNVVELIANHHLDTDRPGPFGAGSLLEVAEVGIATADPDRTRAAIQEALSADVLWGGRPGWRLTAIGDDHGVVIVAPIGRGWIPVGLPARPQPTTIVAAAPRSRVLTLPEGPYHIRAVA